MQKWWKKEYLSYLFEMVKSSKDDLVSSSDQTHSGQQLQNQGFGPAECKQKDTYIKKPNLHKILSATNSDKTFQGKIKNSRYNSQPIKTSPRGRSNGPIGFMVGKLQRNYPTYTRSYSLSFV